MDLAGAGPLRYLLSCLRFTNCGIRTKIQAQEYQGQGLKSQHLWLTDLELPSHRCASVSPSIVRGMRTV